MNLSELQAELRHFAAERDWQPLHTPKNLSTALMVEAAELAEVFQRMTPQESQVAHQTPATKQRIGEEVADILLYLLQVADHSQIDIAQAVKDKLARNASKYPAKQTIARACPVCACVPRTHVLLDYENVQPTADELRTMVPDARQVWVFHGPQQRQVEQRFSSYGANVTAVPISRTGKNALDFHLSFYLGYIASRNQASKIVIVANDKGYQPMVEHARTMGFAVRQHGHVRHKPGVSAKAMPATLAEAVAKPASRKTLAKKVAAKTSAGKHTPVKKTSKKAAPAAAAARASAQKTAQLAPSSASNAPVRSPASPPPSNPSSASADLQKITANLRKMGEKRPMKPASLRRALKSFLGADTGDASIEVALGKLIAAGVVALGEKSDVRYPGFAPQTAAASAGA